MFSHKNEEIIQNNRISICFKNLLSSAANGRRTDSLTKVYRRTASEESLRYQSNSKSKMIDILNMPYFY